jgi:hypothetical protein
MRDLKKQERTAIEAVARLFSATWKKGSDPPDAYICAGRRVAVDITTLKRRGTGQGDADKPHLRFDKVATRLIERLQATLGETVPDGMTVLLTSTAPAAALEDKIQTLLRRGSPGREVTRVGGERSWISAAVSLSMTFIGPAHFGQREAITGPSTHHQSKSSRR